VQRPDEYRIKASECLNLASNAAGSAGNAWNRFFAMAMLWLRLAEQSERTDRLNLPSGDPR
jgi:hypothetical protein